MSIKIVRNNEGNCINFYGSSNPTYWNACLSGEVDPSDNTLVNIKNDIKTAEAGVTQYEFFRIEYTEFVDEDNNGFANAQAVADYITLKGNVTIGTGVTYKGIWDASTNTPDITTNTAIFNAGDFYNVIAQGTHDLGAGDVDFINGDEVIFDGTDWQHKPYAGALIEYDSTSILLNNNGAVYADGAQGLEEPNGSEDGWYFKNDEAGKKINWYFLGNENAGYQITKATLQGGYVRIKLLQELGTDSPFFSLYTTPKGDGYDRFWFRSRYSYVGDFTGVAVGQEVIAYWGEDPSVHPELTRVTLTQDSFSSLISEHPDVSNDSVYTMALGTNSAATVDSIEFIAKELGYKNQQYLRSYLLEAKLENLVISPNGHDLLDKVVDFKLDATSTSIMLDNGYAYGVNTIKAVDLGNGLITIKSIQGDLEHFINLDHTNVTIDGISAVGGLNDVINVLNELFTVGAFQSVVISDPYSTMIADVNGVVTTELTAAQGTAIEIGTDEYGATTGGYNVAGYKTPETINQAGEYFTFNIRNEGIIGFGLIPSQADYDNGDYNGNASYANPSLFCNTSNSAHSGYQFSHWFHPSPDGPWTNYGAKTSYSQREGWNNPDFRFSTSPEGAKWLAGDLVKIKVGIDENNFIVISYFDESTSLFVPIARTSYPVPNGLEYHLGIKFGDTTVRLVGIPKIHELEDLAPTMYFRAVESPDGVYNYPVFATTEEAEYYDDNNGGTGTYTTIVFPDDPTFTTWYIPTNGYTSNGTEIPTTDTFLSNPVTYTEITTLTNADLAPTAFSDATMNINELSAVNIQLHPIDASYVTSIVDTDGSGLTIDVNGIHLNGTAPEVTGDNVSNPSDTYTIEVVRTNAYGSASGTLTLNVSNLTAPSTALSGFTWDNTSAALVDSTTMGEGSVVAFDDTLEEGKRLIIDKAWVETNIYPNLVNIGDEVIIGIPTSTANWSSIEVADFEVSISWLRQSSTLIENHIRVLGGGDNGIGINSLTNALYDFAFEVDNGTTYAIASSTSDMNTEPSPSDGGSFTRIVDKTSFSGPHTIVIATISAETTLSTSGIGEITAPVASSALTPWTKALDFSGSNEHAKTVANWLQSSPLQMGGLANTVDLGTASQGDTSNNTSSRPWATAVVFKSDGYSGNQMIWNQGEGSTDGDDNIFLNVTAAGHVHLGWGRGGAGNGYNQCRIANNISSSNWYGISIAHNGVRLGGNDATAANLADCFDIRLMSSADSFASISSNLSTAANWVHTGYRMDRTVAGDFTIGGRGTSYAYRGKIASMVVTTLLQGGYPSVQMPGGTMVGADQAKAMITDPIKWVNDYKIRTSANNPSGLYRQSSSRFASNYFTFANAYQHTYVWLMGDGTSDSYSNGIRNYINPSDQNYAKLQLNSMVSNDIENVSISGLS